jgi:hypothetical protein
VFGWGVLCYRIARYVSIALVVEFFGTSGTAEVVGVKRLFAFRIGQLFTARRYEDGNVLVV